MPYGHASMLLLGEGSEATEPYNKYDKIQPHSIRSLQFDQKVRHLSFRPEKFDLFTATRHDNLLFSTIAEIDDSSVRRRVDRDPLRHITELRGKAKLICVVMYPITRNFNYDTN